jgi:hypothetical protein
MAEIVQNLLGGQALRLYNEQFGRRMSIGCAWGRIRVIVRYTTQATSSILDSGLLVGVSQGTTDMYRSANCVDFVGAHCGAVLQNTDWTYNAGPPAFASSGGFSTLGLRKVGASVTSVAPGGSTTTYQAIAPTRIIFGADIEKAHNVVKIRPLGVSTQALAQNDYNFGNMMFNTDSDVATIPLIGHSPSFLSVAATGSNQAWDSVNIDWNNGVQPIEISDILVVRFW